MADGFLDAVNERQVPQHEHAGPCQLPAFFKFRAISAKVALDLLAQPLHLGREGVIACHGVASLLMTRNRLDEPGEGDAANLGIRLVLPSRHNIETVVDAERAARELERQDLRSSGSMCLSRLRASSKIFREDSSVLQQYALRIAGGMVSGPALRL